MWRGLGPECEAEMLLTLVGRLVSVVIDIPYSLAPPFCWLGLDTSMGGGGGGGL